MALEQSTGAIVIHHPEYEYFAVRSKRAFSRPAMVQEVIFKGFYL